MVTLMKSVLEFHAALNNQFQVTRNEKGPFEETCCLSGQLCSTADSCDTTQRQSRGTVAERPHNTGRIRSGDQLAVILLQLIWLGLATDRRHGYAEQAQG